MYKNNKFKNKCRTCLDCSKGLQLLTKMVAEDKETKSYGELLKDLTNIDMMDETLNQMPQTICGCCIRKLKAAYAFVQQAHEVNDKLWSMLNESSVDDKPINCLQEAQIDILDCREIKIEDEDESGENKNELPNFVIELKKEESEEVIGDVCSDIKKLANGKKYEKETVPAKEVLEDKTLSNNAEIEISDNDHNDLLLEFKDKDNQKNKILKSRSCDYTASTYVALNNHNRSKHGTEKDKFKCTFCAYVCTRKNNLLIHIKKNHKEIIKTLKAEAKTEELQSENLNAANTLKREENCLDQTEHYSSDDTLLIQKTNQGCTKSDLNVKIYDNEEQLSDEDFIRKILNIRKKRAKSSTSSLAKPCDECGKIYKNDTALNIHKREVHISEDRYCLCPHCGKKYKRKTNLRIHIENVHFPKKSTEAGKPPAKVREKRFMCTECSYVCTTITILKVHINRHHTGEKPHKCDICFKSFLVPYTLRIHRYLHTGERPYKCPICSKAFRDNSQMLRHKHIHSSERPYKCTDCSKSFTQAYSLSVHKRMHLKERKLNCTVCGKLFENMSLLNIHRITENHHDEAT